MASKQQTAVDEGPELMEMPPDEEIGIYPTFLHPDQPFPGWLRDRIIIYKQEGLAGDKAVSIQVNGYQIGIPREVEVDIARPFVTALENTVKDEHYRDESGEEKVRKVRRYNWQMIERGVNLNKLKSALQKKIDQENRRRKKEWQEAKSRGADGNNT